MRMPQYSKTLMIASYAAVYWIAAVNLDADESSIESSSKMIRYVSAAAPRPLSAYCTFASTARRRMPLLR